MEQFEKIQTEILNSITPKLEKKYFVLSEYFGDGYDKPVIGKITKNGYGNSAIILPLNDKRFPETKNFRTLNKYYKNKGMKVYHLKEGLEIIFREKQIPGSDYEDCPELYEKLNKWWESWCIYARQFLDENELHKSCVELADLLKRAVNNTPLSNF